MVKKITSKVIFNKRTGQPMIFPSKRKIRASNPTLKFNEELFARIEIIRKPKKKDG